MKKKELRGLLEGSKHRIQTYTKKISESEKSFRELNSTNIQATLIQFEDYLDNNHLYAFENWIDGVIWDGPNVRRYWIDITLKYPYKMMPDPRGAMRLVTSGAKITYKEDTEIVSIKPEKSDDLDPMTRKPKEVEEDIWLINILVPRRFIEDAIDDYDELEPEAAGQEDEPEAPEEDEFAEDEFGDEEFDEEELEL